MALRMGSFGPLLLIIPLFLLDWRLTADGGQQQPASQPCHTRAKRLSGSASLSLSAPAIAQLKPIQSNAYLSDQ